MGTSARELRAQQAAKRASNGELMKVGECEVQRNQHYRFTTIPSMAVENLDLDAGDDGFHYVDPRNDALVILFGDEGHRPGSD